MFERAVGFVKRKTKSGRRRKTKGYFKPLRGAYTRLGFILAILSLVIGIVKLYPKIQGVIDDWLKQEPILLISGEFWTQKPFDLDECDSNGFGCVEWRGSYVIQNLSGEDINIYDIKPIWKTGLVGKSELELQRVSSGATGTRIEIYDSSASAIEAEADPQADYSLDSLKFRSTSRLPFILKSGETRVVHVYYSYRLYMDDREVAMPDETSLMKVVAMIVGLVVDDEGKCRGGFRDVPVEIDLSKEKLATNATEMLVVVEGCTLQLPGLPGTKTPE